MAQLGIFGALDGLVQDMQEYQEGRKIARDLLTSVLIADLRNRLDAEEYLENKPGLEKLAWEIEVLSKDAGANKPKPI